MAIIELNNIRVSYETKKNKVDAVKDTTIHIEKGDIFGIIGYSGAGKSTIVRTINLLQKPSAGEVKVNGKVCYMRGKKIVSGDIVEFENEKIEVV